MIDIFQVDSKYVTHSNLWFFIVKCLHFRYFLWISITEVHMCVKFDCKQINFRDFINKSEKMAKTGHLKNLFRGKNLFFLFFLLRYLGKLRRALAPRACYTFVDKISKGDLLAMKFYTHMDLSNTYWLIQIKYWKCKHLTIKIIKSHKVLHIYYLTGKYKSYKQFCRITCEGT